MRRKCARDRKLAKSGGRGYNGALSALKGGGPVSNGSSDQPVRVFVSSTWEDLQPERDAVEKALHRMREGAFAGMEYFGSRPKTPRKVSLDEVDRSDIYVGIFAHRYGSGITDAEYRRAWRRGIPCLIYLKDEGVRVLPEHIERDEAKVRKLGVLRRKLKKNHTCSVFGSPDNLATKVIADLHNEIPRLSGQLEKPEPGETDLRTPVPPQPYFVHPYPLQPNFTGRVRERTMLTEWLTKDDRPVLALVAFGGMGKSALTWAWLQRDLLGLPLPGAADDTPEAAEACRVPQDARPEGAFWWGFYDRESSFEGFLDRALAYASGGQAPMGIDSAYEKMEVLVNLLRERRLLLVLDGFERQLRQYASLSAVYQKDEEAEKVPAQDRACADPNAATFLRRLAAGPFESRVLFTSRLFPRELEADDEQPLANCRREDLKSLQPEDAVAFFQAEGVKGTRAEIEAACRPYGYQPLALRLLAGVIVHDKRTPGDIRAAERHGLLKEPKGEKLRRMLEAAYDALDQRKRALLSRIAAFRSAVGYEVVSIFNDYKKQPEFDGALEELIERGLLLFDRERARYDLHPIVRAYAYERLTGKRRVHDRLREYFAAIPVPEGDEVKNVEELAPVIELYHHTVGAGRYDEAYDLLQRFAPASLYFRFGAYQTSIELLRALFPDGEDRSPRLSDEVGQGWALNELANSYGTSGQSRRAVESFTLAVKLAERTARKDNLAIGRQNLALGELKLGYLAAAELNLRSSIRLCGETANQFWKAVGHQELGRLLVFEGANGEANRLFFEAGAYWEQIGDKQGTFLVEAYRALGSLLAGDAKAALESARQAHEIAAGRQNEGDTIRAEWLLGAVLVALASQSQRGQRTHLREAEGHLTEALARCRRINMVDHEPDILLAWGRWHRAKGNTKQALEHAQEALAIADRCEYRLAQADSHNFLAALALEQGDRRAAEEHATTGYKRAWCDGPPHCYKPALEEAERLLKELDVKPPPLKAKE